MPHGTGSHSAVLTPWLTASWALEVPAAAAAATAKDLKVPELTLHLLFIYCPIMHRQDGPFL